MSSARPRDRQPPSLPGRQIGGRQVGERRQVDRGQHAVGQGAEIQPLALLEGVPDALTVEGILADQHRHRRAGGVGIATGDAEGHMARQAFRREEERLGGQPALLVVPRANVAQLVLRELHHGRTCPADVGIALGSVKLRNRKVEAG